MEVFKDYAYFYNMFYNDKNYMNEALQIKSLIEKYKVNKTVSTVLDMGCGMGKHDFALTKLGY